MIRVAIQGDVMIDGIRIGILSKGDVRMYATGFDEHGRLTWAAWPDPAASPPGDATMALPDDVARALMDELVRHYHGASDTVALRRDYDHERGRVDKLTDALITITTEGITS